MNISLEISMYPLQEDFIPAIDGFLRHLHKAGGISVKTNAMSTQVFGPVNEVFKAAQTGIEKIYQQVDQCPFVIKVLNGDVSGTDLNPEQWK